MGIVEEEEIKIVYDSPKYVREEKSSRKIEIRGQQKCPVILNILQGCITVRSQTLDKRGVEGGNKYLQKLLSPH